ncbi:MAG: C25 family cysteine peptidase [Bacteroidales bacterium]|nr:C25 family cysteine peptidase [Bacteroidales bacterium]
MKTIYTLSRSITFLLAMLLLPVLVFTGNVQLNNGKTAVSFKEKDYQKIVFSSSIAGFSFAEVNAPAGMFSMLSIDGFGKRNIEGEPSLPVYRKLIEVPVNATFKVKIIRQHYQEIVLNEVGVKTPVFPAQPPLSKGDDPIKVPFIYSKDVYFTDGWIADDLATVSFIGTMRAINLARIDISPVQYNPVENKLRIYDELEVEIIFENADIPATIELKSSKASPYFNSMYRMVENFKPNPMTDELITSAPVTYVIVSDPMFQATLQPFIAWKKKKGFRVIEGYTNNPAVGNTTTTIKAWLQGLYSSPPAGYNAPSFVLFIGDVAQVPAWAGGAGSHYTDLRYCEYTNDNLPEVYYGRFSATSVAQLQPQVDKTLEYEQYLMPDPSFLNEAVMAAGADASFQTHSNGQIYYGTENYFNAAHGILSHTYLQPEPSGGNYSQNIKNNVSSGVSFANYTAHCSENGWADPSFVISDIASLTNAHKYCLMVGNCCLSAKFDVNSFAEEQLRAVNKGSVGYIGGSNNTYWDEDYWWGCGFKSVVLHPAYDPAHIGAYDGAFHDHGEPVADWFVTQGQMFVCGNYAVEESNTSRKQYYWEIYHLMGDPSLMIYYSVPPALTASYQSPLMIGMTTLTVNTAPYAYIALSMNGILLDARIADATGAATLAFPALNTPGTADIVITKQNRQPHISTIQVIPASGPYVIYTSSAINDPLPTGNNNGQMDFDEINSLNVSLKNVGVQTATNVIATLSTTSPHITMTDNSENFGNINPDQTITMNDAFSYIVANDIPDQQVVPFTLHAVSGVDLWNSSFNITANAPALQVGAMTVQDNCPGCNNDGILDPGETANLVIVNSNNGHAGLSNINGTLSVAGGSSPYLVINNSTSVIGTLATGGSGNAVFSVTADPSTPIGTPVDLSYTVTGGTSGQYTATALKQVVIGLIPTYIMSSTSVTTCTGYFYDPGGPAGSYSNSQDFTMVINPGMTGSMLRVIFSSFELEAQTTCNYDYLKIYDGTNTSAPLLGAWCGTNSPGTIIANNSTGALTFVFHSDVSVTKPGWEASVSCLSGVVINPATFSATAATTTQIDLAWTPNASNHNVMVVCAMTSVFGVPVNGTVYNPGNAIAGGGTVICTDPGTSFNHSGLNPSTTYYYKAFSYDATHNYSSGITTSANTACGTVDAFPWAEGFENAGLIPACWSQEYVTTPGLNWTFVKGNGSSNPATAHGGNFNACLKDASSADNITRLVSPKLNLAGLPQPQLKFWHTQAFWSPDQDLLTVYYRKSATDPWKLLTVYTSSIATWTLETIPLPEATDSYFIAFEGNAKYGYGVCVDDVEISSACPAIYPVGIEIMASANPVSSGTSVMFTATPANGGTVPAFQWELNGTNIPGATNSSYAYIPENSDVITCRLTSDISCASGNPANSNAIVMIVTTIPLTVTLYDLTVTGSQCFDAVQTITVAGSGHTFTVTNGGYATMIAGQNILYLPGTAVVSGGYMYGQIAPGGPFCQAPTKPAAVTGTDEIHPTGGKTFWKIYPNPTSGEFTLEMDGDVSSERTIVAIYGMKGEKIISAELIHERKHEFSLSGMPAGLYLIRVISGGLTGTVRIVKQ